MNVKKLVSRYANASDLERAFLREILKDEAKRASRGKVDPLGESILHKDRTRATGDESWVDYGYILPGDIVFDFDPDVTPTEWDAYLDLTDEEVNEWIEENVVVRIYSDYDCTGRAFTTSVDWHRNPCGLISYQHHMTIDI